MLLFGYNTFSTIWLGYTSNYIITWDHSLVINFVMSQSRRFLSNHLAQIKHIFPEALKLEEFTSWNSEVQCFQKDLRIKLLPISMNTDEGLEPEMKSASKACEMVVRRKEFHRRLIEFAKSHPKVRFLCWSPFVKKILLLGCILH